MSRERHVVGPGVAPDRACERKAFIDDGAGERFQGDVAVVPDVEQRIEGAVEIDYPVSEIAPVAFADMEVSDLVTGQANGCPGLASSMFM